MRVTDEQLALMQAWLTGTAQLAEPLPAKVTEPDVAAGLDVLNFAAFVIATRREFAPTWTRSKVIRFTAEVRGALGDRWDLLDPVIAEEQLRNALGEPISGTPDPAKQTQAQLILLSALVAKADLDETAIAALLSQAREMADQILDDTTGSPRS
jgi:hypothetical protein